MKLNETLENLRVSYQASSLDVNECNLNPIEQFNKWLQEAINSQCDEPNALVLSTISQNKPRSRVVLLKGIIDGNFVFYTNYHSSKGLEIDKNPNACMNFLWLPLQRQVRIEGVLSKVSDEQSSDYFQKRPRGSQLGAIASPQSEKVKSRDDLEQLFIDTENTFSGVDPIPRPLHWGGYFLEAHYIEFWQGRSNRMHDRICFEKKNNQWERFRLAP
jgi:pyridoxamine 5'-phosphate oxidase